MGWVLLSAALAIVGGLLLVPLDLAVRFEVSGGVRARYSLGWLFGLLGREGGLGETPRAGRAPRPGESRGGAGWRRVMPALRSPGFPSHLFGLLGRLLRRIHVRELRASARFGTGDPAETGMLHGLLLPVLLPLGTLPVIALDVEPDFEEAVFQGAGAAAVRLVPLAVLAALVGSLLSPVCLRALWRTFRT